MRPDDVVTALLARTAAAIHTHGHMIWAVGSDECSVPGCECGPDPRPWSYTVGLCQVDHPELLVFGLSPGAAHGIIEWVASQHAAGRTLPVGRHHELQFKGLPFRLLGVPTRCIDPSKSVMGQWYQYYASFGPITVPDVVQVVHADRNRRFPWHADYDRASRFGQPVLQDKPTALQAEVSPIWPKLPAGAGNGRRR
ncbi:MAG: hypothetical protein JWN99_2613 [Ilumatobacteraceae bacterium]|nr:hypothetical protein [Ilumatobacteraceae bacterium]